MLLLFFRSEGDALIRGSRMLDPVLQVVRLLSQGASSNWFGLGCPSHCRGSDLGVVLAAFLFGFLCASVGGLLLLITFVVRAPASGPDVSAAPAEPQPLLRRRLQGYLHGRRD